MMVERVEGRREFNVLMGHEVFLGWDVTDTVFMYLVWSPGFDL